MDSNTSAAVKRAYDESRRWNYYFIISWAL